MPTSLLLRLIWACSAACFTDNTTSISKRERAKPTSPTWLLKRSSTALSSKRDATKLCGSAHLSLWVVSFVRPCSTAAKFSSLVQPKGDDMLCAMQCVIFAYIASSLLIYIRCEVVYPTTYSLLFLPFYLLLTTSNLRFTAFFLLLLLLTTYSFSPYFLLLLLLTPYY